MLLKSIDHLQLCVMDLRLSQVFYQQILAMELLQSSPEQVRLALGEQHLVLTAFGGEPAGIPRAAHSQPGSSHVCFMLDTPLAQAQQQLDDMGVQVVAGPQQSLGAKGRTLSLFVYDPDGNVIEICNYLS